jgi:isocitrate/isopropylmalate dehydrogenase
MNASIHGVAKRMRTSSKAAPIASMLAGLFGLGLILGSCPAVAAVRTAVPQVVEYVDRVFAGSEK